MGVRIRTKMRPHEEIEVDGPEFIDLARQDLLEEVEGQRKPGQQAETSSQPKSAGK